MPVDMASVDAAAAAQAGPVDAGSRFREVVRMLPGVRGEIRSTVTRCEPDGALGKDFEGARMRRHFAYAFVAEGGGTRRVQRQSLELAGWLRPLQAPTGPREGWVP